MSILWLKISCSPWIWADPSFVLFPSRFFAWILRFQNSCKSYSLPLAHHVPIRPELCGKIKLCNVLIVLACCLPQPLYLQYKCLQMWSQSSIKLICSSFVKRTAHRLKYLADIVALISVYQTSQTSIKDSGGLVIVLRPLCRPLYDSFGWCLRLMALTSCWAKWYFNWCSCEEFSQAHEKLLCVSRLSNNCHDTHRAFR